LPTPGPHAGRIRALGVLIPADERPGYAQDSAGRWQATVDLAARALEARRSIRHVPRNRVEPSRAPQKCALLGTVERMGPVEFDQNRKFWQALSGAAGLGAPLRARETFSAIALTKRMAVPLHLAEELGVKRYRRFSDTATVAAGTWLGAMGLLDAVGEDWNGQWLHWRRPNEDLDEREVPPALSNRIRAARESKGWPPAYLAVLTVDGDQMGGWLRGDRNPPVSQAIRPGLAEYYARIGALDNLQAKRPVGPALHAAISEALTNFAMRIAPGIVSCHKGELIYAGGDDVLALLPTETAIACAEDLQRAFRVPHCQKRACFNCLRPPRTPSFKASSHWRSRSSVGCRNGISHALPPPRNGTSRTPERAARPAHSDSCGFAAIRSSAASE
jgi:CRISPR-associated protein Cmr2